MRSSSNAAASGRGRAQAAPQPAGCRHLCCQAGTPAARLLLELEHLHAVLVLGHVVADGGHARGVLQQGRQGGRESGGRQASAGVSTGVSRGAAAPSGERSGCLARPPRDPRRRRRACSEFCVSSRLLSEGETLTNMSVLAVPPMESLISMVSCGGRGGATGGDEAVGARSGRRRGTCVGSLERCVNQQAGQTAAANSCSHHPPCGRGRARGPAPWRAQR